MPVDEAPGAPIFAKAVPGDAKAVVTWGNVSSAGSDPIKHYVVRVYKYPLDHGVTGDGDHTFSAATRQATISGLVNGQRYYFAVWGQSYDATIGLTIDGVAENTAIITPTNKTAPSPPTSPQATAGDASAIVSWQKPTSSGNSAITSYLLKTFDSDQKFVKQASLSATTFSYTVTGLDNATDTVTAAYYFEIQAINAIGPSDPAQTGEVMPAAAAPSVTVSIDSVGPQQIPCTRPGQSLSGAPQVAVKGSNLDQSWGADSYHALEWVLYSDSTYTTIIGNGGQFGISNITAQSMTVTAPTAPADAVPNTQGLIGPWLLKATYVPDPAAPTTTVDAYSPELYCTAVGTLVIGTVNPDPMHDEDLITVTGPDVGIADIAFVTIGGNTMSVPLTQVDHNTVTFTCPTFGYALPVGGDLVLQYRLNGYLLSTEAYNIEWDPATSVAPGSTSGGYVPPPGNVVPDGPMGYPQRVLQWVFSDGIDTWSPPYNPDNMTSPFPTRNVTTKHTSAITGKTLLYEGARQVANWQFSGTSFDAAHYEGLRHWVEDKNTRIQITDHFGRVIDCVLLQFDAVPRKDARRYWTHTYTVHALVLDVGAPTMVPA